MVALVEVSDPTTIGILTAIGVVFAFVAAVAAVTTVLQGKRAWRKASLPDIEWESALINPREGEGVHLEATVVNAGGGSAYSVEFTIVAGDALVRGYFGIMESGRRRTVHARERVPDAEPRVGVVSYRRPDGAAEAVSTDEERRTYRKRLWARELPSTDEIFADLYPDVTLANLRRVTHSFPMLTQP